MSTIASPAVWAGFVVLVLVLLGIDLALHRRSEAVSMRSAIVWTLVWIGLGLGFGGALWAWQGNEVALEYYAGWLVEKSLSVDNVFVFIVLFAAFSVPQAQQHRVLFWGVLGAIVLRFLFIVAGAELLEHVHWVVLPLGAFLAYSGVSMMVKRGHDEHPQQNKLLKAVMRVIPSTHEYHDSHFFIVEAGKRLATPLFLALVAIEISDVIFAVDSVPAVFAVTEDPFIVFTSNIFALLGLRSLTFVLADIMPKLKHLKTGLALILVFVGAKMLLEMWLEIPIVASLGVIGAILAGSVAASLISARREERRRRRRPAAAGAPSA